MCQAYSRLRHLYAAGTPWFRLVIATFKTDPFKTAMPKKKDPSNHVECPLCHRVQFLSKILAHFNSHCNPNSTKWKWKCHYCIIPVLFVRTDDYNSHIESGLHVTSQMQMDEILEILQQRTATAQYCENSSKITTESTEITAETTDEVSAMDTEERTTIATETAQLDPNDEWSDAWSSDSDTELQESHFSDPDVSGFEILEPVTSAWQPAEESSPINILDSEPEYDISNVQLFEQTLINQNENPSNSQHEPQIGNQRTKKNPSGNEWSPFYNYTQWACFIFKHKLQWSESVYQSIRDIIQGGKFEPRDMPAFKDLTELADSLPLGHRIWRGDYLRVTTMGHQFVCQPTQFYLQEHKWFVIYNVLISG